MKMKKLVAIVLTLALSFSAIPTDARENGVTKDSKEAKIEKVKEIHENSRTQIGKVDSKQETTNDDYIKGEAIVVVAKGDGINTLSKGKKFTESIDNDIRVTESYDFTENTVSKKAIKSASIGSQGFYAQLVKSDTLSTKEIIETVEKDASVAYAEPNYKISTESITNDSYEELQWAIENKEQNNGTEGLDTNAEEQWERNEKDSDAKEVVIAVIDSGVDYTHEDLNGVMWNNPYPANQLNGKHGYDFHNKDNDPMDDNGHGTHCAGIIAGQSNNHTGITGISNNNTTIMALKFLDANGSGDSFNAIGCYNYIMKAKKLGTNVVAINNSWGGSSGTSLLNDVMKMADVQGIISVIAAGNSDENLNQIFDQPSSYELPHSVVVGASTENDGKATFSCYGSESVDLAAPGTDILSTVSYDCLNPTIYSQEKREQILSAYHDGKNSMGFGEITATNTSGAAITSKIVTSSNEQYFGVSGSSVGFELKNAKKGEQYTIQIPYDLEESATDIYNSFVIKMGDKDGYNISENQGMIQIDNVVYEYSEYDGKTSKTELSRKNILNTFLKRTDYWSHFDSKVVDASETSKFLSGCLEITVTPDDGNYCFYLDDIGVSKKNISTSQFEKYDFYNGTSMAAPQVAGAIALLAQTASNPDEILSRLFASTRKSEEWKNQSRTGRILDFSKLDIQSPVIRSTKSDGVDTLTLKGYNFGDNKGSITIAGKTVAAKDILSWSDQEIQMTASEFLYKSVEIGITNQAGNQCSSTYLLKNTTNVMDYIGKVGQDNDSLRTVFATDGEKIYYFNEGSLFEVSEEDGKMTELYSINTNDYVEYLDAYQQSSSNLYGINQLIYGNGSLWYLTTIDDGYQCKRYLNEYNIAQNINTISEISDDMISYIQGTLCFYNNRIYCLGGGENEADFSDQVVYYELDSKTWKKDVPLPFKGTFGNAISFNGKMYYVSALDDKYQLRNLYSFDGTQWKEENAEFKYFNRLWDKQSIYPCNSIGLAKDKLIFMSDGSEECGTMMAYDLKQEKLVPTGYSYEGKGLCNGSLGIVTIYDKLYMIAIDNAAIEDVEGCTKMYRMNVEPYEEKKEPEPSPTASPVQTAAPTAVPTISPTTAPSIAPSSTPTSVISGVKKKVGKITVKASKKTVKIGKKIKLKAVIKPSNAYNKKVTWSVSNKKYATITTKGVLKAKKAGAGKKITVTAKAKDGSKKKGTIKIKIKK